VGRRMSGANKPRSLEDAIRAGHRTRLRGAGRVALGVVMALVAGSCLGCTPRAEPGNVLLISVDTLRADHVGAYGYQRATTPNLDRIFAAGVVYENAYSTASYTPPSVASMLTGLLPTAHGVFHFYQLIDEDIAQVCDLLPEIYQSAAVVSNSILTREAFGAGDCFDAFDDYVDEIEGTGRKVWERGARRTTDAAIRWLTVERDPDRKTFLWVHYIDPHGREAELAWCNETLEHLRQLAAEGKR